MAEIFYKQMFIMERDNFQFSNEDFYKKGLIEKTLYMQITTFGIVVILRADCYGLAICLFKIFEQI